MILPWHVLLAHISMPGCRGVVFSVRNWLKSFIFWTSPTSSAPVPSQRHLSLHIRSYLLGVLWHPALLTFKVCFVTLHLRGLTISGFSCWKAVNDWSCLSQTLTQASTLNRGMNKSVLVSCIQVCIVCSCKLASVVLCGGFALLCFSIYN